MAENGCTGACCAVFYIPRTLVELERGVGDDGSLLDEAELIAPMLVPLTLEEANARGERLGNAAAPFEKREDGHLFTCRHWDEETRLCGIYDERPDMCRGYPYGDACQYGDGCTCKGSPIDDLLANAEIVADAVAA